MRRISRSRTASERRFPVEHELDLLLPQPAEHLDVLTQRPTETVLLELGRTQLEDERAELLERLSREYLQLRDSFTGRSGVALEHRPGSFGLQHQAEQLLADGVVEVERQPVPLGDDRELARLLVQPGVRDRDRRMRCEQADQLLVLLGELRALDLLRQIEGADHPGRRDDRNAEERVHVRMRLRPPPAEARVIVDVARAVRLGRVEHGAEHAVLSRQRAERRDQLVAHAGGEEPAEAALAVGQPERRVARPGQLPRAVDQSLQDVVHRHLGRDREHRVADRLQGGAQVLGHRR